jgi:hypothetical protein
MIDYQHRMDFACAQDANRANGDEGRPREYPARPLMPRRGTIWIPSTLITPDEPLTLPSQDSAVELDRTMV